MSSKLNRFAMLLFFVPVALFAIACAQFNLLRNCSWKARANLPIPRDWLKELVTAEQVEKGQTRNKFSINSQDERWLALRAKVQSGDQIWFYSGMYGCPPHEVGCAPPGGEGLVLVRGCTVVERIVLTYIN
jgi:hypothetical protein